MKPVSEESATQFIKRSEVVRTLASAFQSLAKQRQQEVLARVCQKMIEDEAWKDIADLLDTQLGRDASTVVAS